LHRCWLSSRAHRKISGKRSGRNHCTGCECCPSIAPLDAEDYMPRRLDARRLRHWEGRQGGPREPCEAPYGSYGHKTATRRNQPESGDRPSPRPERPTRQDADSQQVEGRSQHDERGHDPEPLQQGAWPWPDYSVDHLPRPSKPEALSQGRECQNDQEKKAKRPGASHVGTPKHRRAGSDDSRIMLMRRKNYNRDSIRSASRGARDDEAYHMGSPLAFRLRRCLPPVPASPYTPAKLLTTSHMSPRTSVK